MAKRKTLYKYRSKRFIPPAAQVIFLIVLGLYVLLIPGQNAYTVNFPELQIPSTESRLPIPSPAPYPENVTGIVPGSEITAQAVSVRDVDSGVFLYTRNESQSLAPASTTKILTALVALESYRLDDVVTVQSLVNDGQQMGLIPGERITVENLLYGALIHSGNDAAHALAEHHPGGVSGFVQAMNQKARDLHLAGSSFTNPVGYDDPGQVITARDLALLASAALEHPVIVKMVAIPSITISDVTHTYYHPLKNVNELLGKIPGVAGIKTGWTEAAGENLVTLVDRGGHRIIFVVLKSQDRFSDTIRLIDWVNANFRWKDFSHGE